MMASVNSIENFLSKSHYQVQKKLKGQILKNEKKPNFLQKFIEKTRFKVTMSLNISSFAQISLKNNKTRFKIRILGSSTLKKWQNHFISGKKIQKGQMATMIITVIAKKPLDFFYFYEIDIN